jgi:uncharacterized protein
MWSAKHVLILFVLFINCPVAPVFSQSLSSFDLSAVHLGAGPFNDAQLTDLRYILALDPDRLLVPFQREGGISTKATSYGNWENTGLDGHIGGHYLSALSLMYASTGHPETKRRLDYMIDKIAECQNKSDDGYVGGIPGGRAAWKEIHDGKINAGSFSLNGKWVPLYNIHKLFAGLYDAYILGKNDKAKTVFLKLCDWFVVLTSPLSEKQFQEMLRSEHGGMNEVFAFAFELTRDKKYLDIARKLSHRTILNPLLSKRDSLTGLHANTQIPKVVGFQTIAKASDDTAWSAAASFFWHTVVEKRTVSIGGNSVREHFHPSNDFGPMIESNQGPETCNTYNMLRLSKALFLSNPDLAYLDYYERALYNHILSSQHPSRGGFVYFTPMRPRHYRVYSNPQESFWCCVGSGLENHGKYGELIYAHSEKDLFVNLFIPSTLDWKERDIQVRQETRFPFQEASTLILNLKRPSRFVLNIRHPSWVRSGELKISVNGTIAVTSSKPGTFVPVARKWRNGDVVSISLPMHTEVEYLPDGSSWASFVHGPIVLAAATDTTDLKGLVSGGSRMGHVAEGKFYPVDEAPVIVKADKNFAAAVKPVENQPLTFTVSDLIYPDRYKNVKLRPFFTIHDQRYMVYWLFTSPDSLAQLQENMQRKENELQKLRRRTIDEVFAGEQQPEVEHNFRGEATETGSSNGRSWRSSVKSFSYDLKNPDKAASILRVSYGGGFNRKFEIFLNEAKLESVSLENSWDNHATTIDYEIPLAMKERFSSGTITVRFVAHENASTGQVIQVSLLKEEN